MAKKPTPLVITGLRKAIVVGEPYYTEDGRKMLPVQYVDPPAEPERPLLKPLTLRHQMILAIIRRHYPKRIPDGVGYADLTQTVGQDWPRELERKKVNFAAPNATRSRKRFLAPALI
jgi:hypothetical protein